MAIYDLKHCGKGWFVLRLANDLLETEYTIDTSREKEYSKNKKFAEQILIDLISCHRGSIMVASAGMNSSQVLNVAEKLLDLIKEKPEIIRGAVSPAETKGVVYGDDRNCNNVSYYDNVTPEEKIPGLVPYLENEYGKICSYAQRTFQCNDFKKIHVFLSKDTPEDIYRNSELYLAKKIKYSVQLNPGVQAEKIVKMMHEDRTVFSDRIGGEYFGYSYDSNPNPHDPFIVIYYKNIHCDSYEEYKAEIAQILAHEFMHYVHNVLAGRNFAASDMVSERVKEALAECFSVLYSIDNAAPSNKKMFVAERCYDAWKNRFGTVWPYASALWFFLFGDKFCSFAEGLTRINEISEKLKGVLKISMTSMQDAYGYLCTSL